MILMSKYKGQHGGKKGKKKLGKAPPPLFGQCPKEIDFSPGRCSLIGPFIANWGSDGCHCVFYNTGILNLTIFTFIIPQYYSHTTDRINNAGPALLPSLRRLITQQYNHLCPSIFPSNVMCSLKNECDCKCNNVSDDHQFQPIH